MLTRQYNLYFLTRPEHNDENISTLHTLTLDTDTSTLFENTLSLLVHCYADDVPCNTVSTNGALCTVKKLTLQEMFDAVHGGRNFHRGIKATYESLNFKFPGNAIPLRVIAELISVCPTCQKVRLSYEYALPSEVRTLKPPHVRTRIGIDTLTVTPRDKFGNDLAIVIVEHFSKFMSIYPCGDYSAENTARAMFQHYVRYGGFKQVISNPGSDYMSLECIVI